MFFKQFFQGTNLGNKTAGLLLVLGAAAVATVLAPRLSKLRSPANSAGRAATRTGLMLYGKTREVMSEMGEIVDDLVAEVEADIAATAAAATAGAEQAAEAESGAATGSNTTGPSKAGEAKEAAGDAKADVEGAAEAAPEADAPRSAA